MAQPDTYTSSGTTIYAGRTAPALPTPAWMTNAGVALNKLVAIPNSQMGGTPAASCGIFAYSGLSIRRDTCEIFSAACGGHGDSNDNGVYSFGPKGQGLLADNPTWIMRCPPTPINQRVAATPTALNYYQPYDSKPTSRHSYDRHHYIGGSLKRIYFFGGTGLAGTAIDDASYRYAYDVEADAWDAPIPFTYGNSGYSMAVDHQNNLLWMGMLKTWDPTSGTFSSGVSNSSIQVRFPTVIANDFNIAFCLQFGNGFTNDPTNTVNASKITLDTKVQTAVTFNPSAAYTQFMADAAIVNVVPGMDYDEVNKVFYWYQGQAGQENHLYVIRPNTGNVWDMELFQFAAGSVTMSTCANSGLCGRLKYLPLLKGIVIYPTGGALQYSTQPMYFLKTSN